MPVSISLLPDEVIARGITGADWGKGFEGYFAGQEQAQKQALQNLFRGGLPRDAAGNIDYNAVAEQLARISGAGAIPTLTSLREADIQQHALGNLEKLGPSIFGPVGQQPRPQLPPSTQRSAPAPEPGGGEPLRPGQQGNLGEITGVEYGPVQTSVADRFTGEPQQDTRYPPEFSQAPVTGPPVGRFTPSPATTEMMPRERVAQAPSQARPPPPPPPAQPLIPEGSPGFFSEQNAAAYEAAAARANYVATVLGVGKMAAGVAGPKQQSEQLAATAKQIRETIANRQQKAEEIRLREGATMREKGEEHRLKTEAVMPEAAAKANITRLEKSQEKAEATASGVTSTQDLFDQLNSKSGIFTGAWANEKLKLAQIAQALGYPIAPEQITSTQTFMSLMGKQVAAGVKAFGSGTSITDADRQYVQKAVGGDIALDETSIRRILEINDKINRETIKKHNADVDRVIKSSPAAAGQLEPFRVAMPPPVTGRMQQPKPGPAGTMPPAPAPEQRQIGQIYQTPKGPHRWLGNGWGPP
jgi:hypothetical protein